MTNDALAAEPLARARIVVRRPRGEMAAPLAATPKVARASRLRSTPGGVFAEGVGEGLWREPAQPRVRWLLGVIAPPKLQRGPGLLQRAEQGLVQGSPLSRPSELSFQPFC